MCDGGAGMGVWLCTINLSATDPANVPPYGVSPNSLEPQRRGNIASPLGTLSFFHPRPKRCAPSFHAWYGAAPAAAGAGRRDIRGDRGCRTRPRGPRGADAPVRGRRAARPDGARLPRGAPQGLAQGPGLERPDVLLESQAGHLIVGISGVLEFPASNPELRTLP